MKLNTIHEALNRREFLQKSGGALLTTLTSGGIAQAIAKQLIANAASNPIALISLAVTGCGYGGLDDEYMELLNNSKTFMKIIGDLNHTDLIQDCDSLQLAKQIPITQLPALIQKLTDHGMEIWEDGDNFLIASGKRQEFHIRLGEAVSANDEDWNVNTSTPWSSMDLDSIVGKWWKIFGSESGLPISDKLHQFLKNKFGINAENIPDHTRDAVQDEYATGRQNEYGDPAKYGIQHAKTNKIHMQPHDETGMHQYIESIIKS